MAPVELLKSVKKACSIEETSPKRKHVRACIVYTWDHRSTSEFFTDLKSLPIINDEVQVFKCLILMHKVIQEGHPSALKEAVRNRDWIRSLGGANACSSYSKLIQEYVRYLILKVDFHVQHPGFQNGIFEYKEYISLVSVSDPDKGYETILDLMSLQDSLDRFSTIILASIDRTRSAECKIAALVPLVAESYGIYKFITSMLRAMCEQFSDEGAMEQLVGRFEIQHSRLFELYADCSSIKYLTSLISLPKLPPQPPIFSAASPRSQIRTNTTATNTTPTPTPPSTVGSPTISPDLRLAIHLGLQSINHFQDPVSTLSISQLANEVATQFLNQTPHIPTIIQLTHQITTLLQRNPSPLLAQASQLYFQALLSPSQQDIINANTNLQQLLTN